MGKFKPLRRTVDGDVIDASGDSLLSPGVLQGSVDAGAGLMVRREVGFRWTPDGPDDDPPFGVTMWATYDDDQRSYVIDGVEILRIDGGPTVTSNAFRSIPVAGIFLELKSRAVVGVADSPDSLAFRNAPGQRFVWPNNELPRRLDDDAYQKIGVVHRVADLLGNRATQDVADHFGVSRTTAYTWIKEVEERGLMEPIVSRGTKK